ncbi:MAG: ATP-binding cassette domain-containing protein [bacterium]|nr:ATP-binding cassette domain-containing protein [bacterium]
MAFLEIDSIVKRFGTYVANDNVSFSVEPGRIFGLLGPNGAGKTTLIRMITNIILPDSGTITIGGEIVSPKQQNVIGYLPEERGLYKKLKVGEQLTYFGRLKGLSATESLRRGLWWLERLDAVGWENKKIQELSKGMQQKVQFIATVLHEPTLLILDEPFSGLDPVNSDLLIRVVKDLQERGTTILLSTHQMDQVERLCDDIVLIDHGRIVLDGSVREVKSRFRSDRIILEFEGDDTTLRSLYEAHIIQSAQGRLEFRLEANSVSSNTLLADALATLDVRKFEVAAPSLHDIFVRTVTAV